MSLKDNVNAIKEELSAEEQFLESVIKAEGFWKKYKKPIIFLATAIVLGLIAKAIMGYMHEKNIESSNNAYNLLAKKSDDQVALSTLKNDNPKLFEMYLFKNAMQKNDVSSLEKVKSEITDPILKDLLTYQISSLNKNLSTADGGIAKEFALFQEGYLLLKENKIKEANAKFAQIPKESTLQSALSTLKHYSGQ